MILTRANKTPWDYARFLNYCVERRLMQRIGGRYRFIHKELLEHFAPKVQLNATPVIWQLLREDDCMAGLLLLRRYFKEAKEKLLLGHQQTVKAVSLSPDSQIP